MLVLFEIIYMRFSDVGFYSFIYSIVGTDNSTIESPTLTIPILLCTDCNGRGTCDFNTPRPGQTANRLTLVKCTCNTTYQGILIFIQLLFCLLSVLHCFKNKISYIMCLRILLVHLS